MGDPSLATYDYSVPGVGVQNEGFFASKIPPAQQNISTGSLLSTPLNRVMFDPHVEFNPKEPEGFADEGVRVFLAANTAD
jgi:hypothetical protein